MHKNGWKYQSHVDFQLGVKVDFISLSTELDSISLPDICTESLAFAILAVT